MARSRDVDIRVTSNEKAFLVALKEHGIDVMNVAGPRALNATLRNIRSRLRKELLASYAMRRSDDGMTPARRIRSLMKATRAHRNALEASLSVDFKPVSLKYFTHSMPRAGVRVRVMKGGERKPIPHAFGPQQRTKNLVRPPVMGGHIYQREGDKRRPTRGYWVDWARKSPGRRVPLRERLTKLHGPSIRARAGVLLEEWRDDGWLQERLAANIEQEARGRVSQLKRQAAKRAAKGRR